MVYKVELNGKLGCYLTKRMSLAAATKLVGKMYGKGAKVTAVNLTVEQAKAKNKELIRMTMR